MNIILWSICHSFGNFILEHSTTHVQRVKQYITSKLYKYIHLQHDLIVQIFSILKWHILIPFWNIVSWNLKSNSRLFGFVNLPLFSGNRSFIFSFSFTSSRNSFVSYIIDDSPSNFSIKVWNFYISNLLLQWRKQRWLPHRSEVFMVRRPRYK